MTVRLPVRKENTLLPVICVTAYHKMLNTDVSLRVEDTETTEAYKVSGRGELHLSVSDREYAPRRI